MAENDPHGWILSITAVCVVFLSLTLLWLIFWLFFSPKNRARMRKMIPTLPISHQPDGEVAAVIAAALDLDDSGEVYAAIAAAMDLYLAETVHDKESYIITIRRSNSDWSAKTLNFRKLPKK